LTVLTQLIMLLLTSLALAGSNTNIGALWSQVSLIRRSMLLLYHLLTIHMLWYAPIYGYLLMISVWARRAAFLWAALPLAAIAIIERIAFNSSGFVNLLQSRIGGGSEGDVFMSGMAMDTMSHLKLVEFLINPGLWVGLALAAAFLAIAVRLRRSATPI